MFSLIKQLAFSFAIAGFVCATYLTQPAFSAKQLVSSEQASSNGLHRAWFAQARVDPARNHVVRWTLSNNELFALTSSSTVHAMNAQTGKTLWVAQVGNPHYPSSGPAANSNRVALLNGSSLYLFDRQDGHVIWTRKVGSAAGAAPALNESFAYVALVNGRIEGYPIDAPKADIWQFQSAGHIFQQPVATAQYVAWPTDRGYLYVGDAEQSKVFFRIETNEEIIASPAEWKSRFYVASLNGYLYCYDSSTGNQLWRYSTGMAIVSKPVVIENKVFVASEMPALHAVDATTGKKLWTIDGVNKFVAQSAQHVYVADRYDNLLILDKETGNIAGQLNTPDGIYPIANEQSDRIFLASKAGLIQCLHEIGANEPTFHQETAATEKTGDSKKDQSTEETTTPPEDSPETPDNPFAPEPPPTDNFFDNF